MTAGDGRFGAWPERGGTRFRVWAPVHQQVDLVVERGTHLADAPRHPSAPESSASRQLPWVGAALRDATVGATLVRETTTRDIRPLAPAANGFWERWFDDIGPGARYRFRLDGNDARTFPDPASRFQPLGVHGPSEVIDPGVFEWHDADWPGLPLSDLIIYELHVGAFTRGGTFEAVIAQLPSLAALGVTAIELMPIADFAGDRNWGYDGVALFAPARCYGRPDDLRRLVDAAHAAGLAVLLDVVYNHFGPDGAYVAAFSPYFFSEQHESPWGRAINVDGAHSATVRRFFIDNAIHWCREYHVDGLRLDATHAIVDDSARHFLQELSDTVRGAIERPVHLCAEDHRNLARLVTPSARGGWGVDAVWADDFHHELHVHLTHEHEGYYRDYTGSTADLAATIAQGWLYTGQFSAHLGEPRGTSPADLEPPQFIVCLQNHDQIGNRAHGERLHHDVDPAAWRAASVLLFTVPETPLLFMGQEWGASTPFLYFTDHQARLGAEVTEGRRREFRAFEAFADPAARHRIPDPQDPATFDASALQWQEREREPHNRLLRLYQRLIALRRRHPALRAASWASCEVAAPDPSTIVMWRWPEARDREGLLIVARLDGHGTMAVSLDRPNRRVEIGDAVLTTEDADISSDPESISWSVEGARLAVTFRRPGAAVLAIVSRGTSSDDVA